MRMFVVALIVILVVPVAAAHEQHCAGTVLYIQAFSSASDQLAALHRAAIDGDADAVQTAVVPQAPGVSHRYLVLTLDCDAYVVIPTGGVRVKTTAVVIPEDHPYEWQFYADLAAAAAEFELHAGAAARGLTSLSDGSIAVYWTKASR